MNNLNERYQDRIENLNQQALLCNVSVQSPGGIQDDKTITTITNNAATIRNLTICQINEATILAMKMFNYSH